MKTCTKCSINKNVCEFGKHTKTKDGLRSQCNLCRQQYREANRTSSAEYSRKWRSANRGLRNASKARRRAAKLNATPKWLTAEQMLFITSIYNEAVKEAMHVDHIIPLQGVNVSGLHVPWNLQLLTPLDNLRKGNR